MNSLNHPDAIGSPNSARSAFNVLTFSVPRRRPPSTRTIPGRASHRSPRTRALFLRPRKETDELSGSSAARRSRSSSASRVSANPHCSRPGSSRSCASRIFCPLYLRLDHDCRSTSARQSAIGKGNSLVEQVKLSLNAAFAAAKADAPALRDDETLWEYFHRKDVDIWSAKNRLLTPVLAFDQFEEIFTLGRADETAASARARFS